MPENTRFGPLDLDADQKQQVKMTVDEYETLRLIDLEGLTQEECARQMNVARTTVQGIYMEARKKMAESLVNGRELLIEGASTGFAMALMKAVDEIVTGTGTGGGRDLEMTKTFEPAGDPTLCSSKHRLIAFCHLRDWVQRSEGKQD